MMRQHVFEAGADKISINSAALADPTLIGEIGRSFGAQAVVVAIDARRDPQAGSGAAMRRCLCTADASPRAGAWWIGRARRRSAAQVRFCLPPWMRMARGRDSIAN